MNRRVSLKEDSARPQTAFPTMLRIYYATDGRPIYTTRLISEEAQFAMVGGSLKIVEGSTLRTVSARVLNEAPQIIVP